MDYNKKTDYFEEDLKIISSYLEEKGYTGKTFMITGATGLIGSIIIRAIVYFNQSHDEKIKVVALARNPEKVKQIFGETSVDIPELDFVYQDIAAKISSRVPCDYIIHTANSTSSAFFMTNPVEVIESIYAGTKSVLDFAVSTKAKGVVYLSSMEVFGRVDIDKRVHEEDLGYLDIQNIRSCYSEGKRLAELLCKSYASEYNLPVKVARLAQTFGAGVPKTENRVFAQFARSASRGEDIVLHTTGESMGNYCYLTDVVHALLLLLKDGTRGDTYTVVNEETTRTIAEMAQMVASSFSEGKSKVIFDIPEGNYYGYAPATKMQLSSEKIRKLGWEPRYSLKEMYERMMPSIL